MIQFVLLFLLIAFPRASRSETVTTQTVQVLGSVKVGQPLPSFNGQGLKGLRISSRDVVGNGQTLVISYCATWCQPCREGLTIIEAEVQTNPTVDALYIALDKEPIKVQRWANELGLNSTIIVDRFQTVAKRHGVVVDGQEVVLPITFVVSQMGVVETIFTVEGEDFSNRLHTAILTSTSDEIHSEASDDVNDESKAVGSQVEE